MFFFSVWYKWHFHLLGVRVRKNSFCPPSIPEPRALDPDDILFSMRNEKLKVLAVVIVWCLLFNVKFCPLFCWELFTEKCEEMTVESNRFNVLVLVNYSISSFRSFTNNFNSQSMLTSKAMHEYKTIDRGIFPKCPCYHPTVLFTVLSEYSRF